MKTFQKDKINTLRNALQCNEGNLFHKTVQIQVPHKGARLNDRAEDIELND